MKTFTLALPLALASLSLAQLQGLPTCAQGCANIFLSGGIGNCGRDPTCICANKDFISAISCCLIGACDASDQQKAIDFAQQICQANQVSVPNTVVCTSTSTSASAGAETTSSTTPATNTAAATTTTDISATTSTGSATTSSSTTTSTGTTSPTSSSGTASGNAGARQTAAPVLGALGGILAAAALL
ncbi:hypothetical protein CONLIGDRAFT_383576 [Coniochaeta ligniaria NRRL 30616]|uniref:CFEM domain-containing protein n=1 Tax=Coniochaeta ligniaria NRRL 30616 TaxID=1408157 RepID=A0A1J7JFR9_9PEZI|nr:hypothetical protein CONLIGDRAFT_383576 [Coniochaeta ligniaria NRRL 30616]